MGGVSREDGAAGGKGVWGRLLAKILDNIQVTHAVELHAPLFINLKPFTP